MCFTERPGKTFCHVLTPASRNHHQEKPATSIQVSPPQSQPRFKLPQITSNLLLPVRTVAVQTSEPVFVHISVTFVNKITLPSQSVSGGHLKSVFSLNHGFILHHYCPYMMYKMTKWLIPHSFKL